MSDKPLWVRWYSTDMLGSGRVARMTRDEEYLYRRLLDYQAADGFVVPDPARLAFACKMTPDEFARAWAAISDCFEEHETGRFRNRRMHAERARVFSAVESARQNGRRGGRPTGDPAKADRKPGGSVEETGRVTGQEPPGKAIREPRAEKRPTPDGVGAHAPPGQARKRAPTFGRDQAIELLPEQHRAGLGAAWAGWVGHLWQRKRPTESALQKHLAALAKVVLAQGYPAAVRLLDEAVTANAQGLQPWAIERAMHPPGANGQRRETAADAAYRASQDALDRVLGVESRNTVFSRTQP